MRRDPRQSRIQGLRAIDRVTRRIVVCLAVLFCSPPAGAQSTPNPCDLDATANKPCTIEIALDGRDLTQALPFDVPVFLNGTANDEVKRLILHVFSAREPLRVERACNQSGVSWADCPPKERQLVCYHESSPGRRDKEEEGVWSYDSLDKSAISSKIDCQLEPRVSTWNRVSPSDDQFALRVPPEPANRYFVFLLDVGSTPAPAQRIDIEKALEKKIAAAVWQRMRQPAQSFQEWAQLLREDLCGVLERVGAEKNVRFEMETESLLSCPPSEMSDLPAQQAPLNAFLSNFSNIIDQARRLEELRTKLKRQNIQLPNLAGPQPFFGLILDDLNSANLDPTPIFIGLKRVNELDQDLASANMQLLSTDDQSSAREAVAFLKTSAAEYHRAVAPAAMIASDVIALDGSNIGSFLTRQKSYLAADFGVLYSWDAEQALPYIGTSIYAKPVNKQAPLSGLSPFKRLALTVGFTVGDFDNDRAEPLFSTVNLLLGGGVRVTESIRVGGGAVVFRESARDPLSKTKKVVYSPYASISFDYDVQSLVKWFNKIIPGGS